MRSRLLAARAACACAALSSCGHISVHRADIVRNLGKAIQAADGRSYYLFAPGYRCTGMGPDAKTLPSWQDHIEVRDGRLVRWADRCADQGIPLDEAKMATAQFNSDLDGLTLGGKAYRYSADPIADLAEDRP